MKHFEKVYWTAVKTHGIITTSEATALGVSPSELNRYCKDGRLSKKGRSVYALTHFMPTPLTRYAEAVALVGKSAYLYGDSVLALHGLLDANPSVLCVASKARVRRSLPEWICVRRTPYTDVCVEYEGVPCQLVANAIAACEGDYPAETLGALVDVAMREELVTEAQRRSLLEGLGLCAAALERQTGVGNV